MQVSSRPCCLCYDWTMTACALKGARDPFLLQTNFGPISKTSGECSVLSFCNRSSANGFSFQRLLDGTVSDGVVSCSKCRSHTYASYVIYIIPNAPCTLQSCASARRTCIIYFALILFVDTLGWPTAGCRFPDWIGDVNWIDLSGKHYYILHNKNSTISVDYKRQANAKPHTKYAFRCVSLRNYNDATKEYTYITHASREWWAFFFVLTWKCHCKCPVQ